MRRIAEGIVLGFTTCCVLTFAAVITAFALHRVEIPFFLTVSAALPRGLPEVELTGSPFGFTAVLVLVAAAYAFIARKRVSRAEAPACSS